MVFFILLLFLKKLFWSFMEKAIVKRLLRNFLFLFFFFLLILNFLRMVFKHLFFRVMSTLRSDFLLSTMVIILFKHLLLWSKNFSNRRGNGLFLIFFFWGLLFCILRLGLKASPSPYLQSFPTFDQIKERRWGSFSKTYYLSLISSPFLLHLFLFLFLALRILLIRTCASFLHPRLGVQLQSCNIFLSPPSQHFFIPSFIL